MSETEKEMSNTPEERDIQQEGYTLSVERQSWEPKEAIDPIRLRRRQGIRKGMGNAASAGIAGGLIGKV